MEHGRARGESLGAGVGVEEFDVLFGEADADFHTLMLPPVVHLAEHPRECAILPAMGGIFGPPKARVLWGTHGQLDGRTAGQGGVGGRSTTATSGQSGGGWRSPGGPLGIGP